MSNGSSNLGVWDIVVLVIYFVSILGFGIWSSKGKKETASSYFLAYRSMHWIPVGASVYASNIGSGLFFGFAGSGASAGVAVAGFELWSVTIVLLLGWVFVPVYMSSKVSTTPEYLKKRFGGQRIRIYLACFSLIMYIVTKISFDLYAGGLFIQMAIGKESTTWFYISIFVLLAFSAIFTIVGGMKAVIWTDLIQTVFMVVGSIVLMAITLVKVGGFNAIIEEFPYALPENFTDTNCGMPNDNYLESLRTTVPGKSDYPWTGMFTGLTVMATWYFCTDQVMVQRTLASKRLSYAKAACIICSYLKILPLFTLVFPGMAARILFPDTVGCIDPEECSRICGNPAGCTNIAYPELVLNLLPQGLAGLMLSVMMAALVTSLTSIFNSASTIFACDIWKKIRKGASEKELLRVGRCFVGILVTISVIWVPVIRKFPNSRMFDYMQTFISYLTPPIVAVFFLAIFVHRVTESGAFWGLMFGLTIGVVRFILEFSFPRPLCGVEDLRPSWIIYLVDNVHYLHFSVISFLLCITFIMSISLLTKPIPREKLRRLTFWTRHDGGASLVLENNGAELARVDGNEEADISETQFEKRLTNTNAILCLCIAIFVWCFFN